MNEAMQNVRPGLLLTRLIPNVMTLFALCAGLSAIRFALQERWEAAVIAVVIAAIFDVLDGRIARMLNTTSKFGAELDSLSDLISFGIAPALMLYLWTLQSGGSFGWLAVLGYAVCTALRLARFNTMLEDPNVPIWQKSYFTGVPAPAGAGLAMLPLIWNIELGAEILRAPVGVSIWLLLVAGLMVSRIPTMSLKGHRVPRSWVLPLFLGLCLIAAQLVTNTWLTLGCIGLIYLGSLPVGWVQFRQRQNAEGKAS